MNQITKTKLDKLNTFELYKHHAALSSSLSLLTPDSRDLALEELERCVRLRSGKIDAIHYHMTQHKKLVEVGKEEKKMLDQQIKHHEAEILALRSLLQEVRRRGYAEDNKIHGERYTFTVSPLPEPSVEIHSSIEDWSDDDQSKYAMVEETITTTFYKAINGKDILRSDEKVKHKHVPNLDAIKEAHAAGHVLPSGVRVLQNHRIQVKRNLESTDGN
jgi:hypothetical protein